MAIGLISLAYLGEIAVVFNIAYIELKKTRYIEAIKKHLDGVKAKIEVNSSVNTADQKKMMELNQQIENMLDKTAGKRKAAWFKWDQGGQENDGKHHDFYAGAGFNFYEKELDKKICEVSLITATLLILSMTICQHINCEFFSAFGVTVSLWDLHFWLLFFANAFPAIFIILGRRMKGVAIKCSDSIQNEYTKISGGTIKTKIAGAGG